MSCVLPCPLPDPLALRSYANESEQPVKGPVLLSLVVVAVPSSMIETRCHRVSAAALPVAEEGLLSLQPLEPAPTPTILAAALPMPTLSSYVDPRKIATARRIRDGGKFKRVQTQV